MNIALKKPFAMKTVFYCDSSSMQLLIISIKYVQIQCDLAHFTILIKVPLHLSGRNCILIYLTLLEGPSGVMGFFDFCDFFHFLREKNL